MPNMKCTANGFDKFIRKSDGKNYLNSIQSALVRSHKKLPFTCGKVEVCAHLPRSDRIWPAIWLLPTDSGYERWPASGEIDIMEDRGNAPGYPGYGCNTIGSALYIDPNRTYNRYPLTCNSYTLSNDQTFSDDFHIFTLDWTPNYIRTFVDSNIKLSSSHGKSY